MQHVVKHFEIRRGRAYESSAKGLSHLLEKKRSDYTLKLLFQGLLAKG